MSKSYQGGKGDSNRVKDHKNYGEKFDQIKNTLKPSKSYETEASRKRREQKDKD